MQPLILDKGVNGLPSSSVLADLSDRKRLETSFTNAALWGPLEASISWPGGLDEGFEAAERWLGNPLEIWSPDGEWCWEGLVWTVTFGAGRRSRSRSLEGYANLVRVHWRTADWTVIAPVPSITGAPQVATDAAGQLLYGTLEYQHNAGDLVIATAQSAAARILSERSRLFYLPESGADTRRIELHALGWYLTLGYQGYVATTVGEADIATVMQNILTAKAPFLSTDYSGMALTGVTTGRQFDLYETPMEIIKRLVLELPGHVFYLDRGRIPVLEASKRISTAIDYFEDSRGVIRGAGGEIVAPWNIRPNRILRQTDFVPSSSLLAAAADSVESLYLAEVTYDSKSNDVTYKAAVSGMLGEVNAL